MSNAIKIVNVDKMSDGLVVSFQDGKVVYFSTELLNRTIASALTLSAGEPPRKMDDFL